MATRTITIKDAHVAEMIEVFSRGWNDQMAETKNEYAERMFNVGVRNYIKQRVLNYRQIELDTTLDETDITDDNV